MIVLPRSAILFLLASAPLSGDAKAQQTTGPDSLVIGEWSATIAAEYWDLNLEPNHQYSISRVTQPGETLVASMGKWTLDADSFCIMPVGRQPICGRLTITGGDDPAERRWRFTDRGGSGFSWMAYRLGYAPWDTPERRRRAVREVYQLSDVATEPRLLGCSQPLELPEGAMGPLRVLTRFVVEPDSSVSAIEIINPPSDAIRDAAYAIAESCRVAPGRLANGRVVRVRVELPLDFRPSPAPPLPSDTACASQAKPIF